MDDDDDDDGDMDCETGIQGCFSVYIFERLFQGASKLAFLTECGVPVYLSRTWRLGVMGDGRGWAHRQGSRWAA